MKDTSCIVYLYIYTPFIITFIIKPLVTIFFMTLTNCDLNVYNHIPYKPLCKIVIIGKNNLTK